MKYSIIHEHEIYGIYEPEYLGVDVECGAMLAVRCVDHVLPCHVGGSSGVI